MKTTGVLPEALADSISRHSRSLIDAVPNPAAVAFAPLTSVSDSRPGSRRAHLSSSQVDTRTEFTAEVPAP
jgi:hypothetical protein